MLRVSKPNDLLGLPLAQPYIRGTIDIAAHQNEKPAPSGTNEAYNKLLRTARCVLSPNRPLPLTLHADLRRLSVDLQHELELIQQSDSDSIMDRIMHSLPEVTRTDNISLMTRH